jgi:hypothetical protein
MFTSTGKDYVLDGIATAIGEVGLVVHGLAPQLMRVAQQVWPPKTAADCIRYCCEQIHFTSYRTILSNHYKNIHVNIQIVFVMLI